MRYKHPHLRGFICPKGLRSVREVYGKVHSRELDPNNLPSHVPTRHFDLTKDKIILPDGREVPSLKTKREDDGVVFHIVPTKHSIKVYYKGDGGRIEKAGEYARE